MASPESTLPNDEKEAQDSAHNPGQNAYDKGMGSSYANAGLDQQEAHANDPANHDGKDRSDSVRDAEESGGWKSNYAGNKSKSGKGISVGNFKAIAKKRGPLAAILTLIFGGGIGAGIFFGPSLLLIQIQEQFLTKFNSQETSMTIRANKMISSKILGNSTSGSCEYIKVACRFSRPSNKLLVSLEKSGITAVDKNGTAIKKTGPFQSDRPKFYKFGDDVINAKEFSKKLNTDPKLRAAFHRAYNPRVVGFTDSVFRFVSKKFGFDKKNRLGGKTDPQKIQRTLNDSTKGTSDTARAALSEGSEEASEGVISKLIKERGAKILGTLSKAGKGGATTLAAGVACAATNVPGAVIAVSRAYQMRQVIAYGMTFLTTASAMKASAPNLTGESVSVLGSALTETVDGKSGMDSFGVKNALYGDTAAEDNSFKKYAPGVMAVSALGGLAAYTGSTQVKDSCAVALNPVTGAALNATLVAAGGATLGTTAFLAGLNLAAGFTLNKVISAVAPAILTAVVPLVAPLVQASAGAILGDITVDLSGQDVGNAFASGAGHVMGQTANAGGNVPLSVDQAVAYNKTTQDVQLAYAEEDRATLSPFDATNKNTLVGSMISKLLPYYSQFGSISGTLRTMISIPFLSLSTIGTNASAASSAEQYTLCDDPAIKDADVAAGPFCNIEYGIPPEYLAMEPMDVVNELIATGDVDAYTGKPKTTGNTEGPSTTDLQGWIDLCTDGSTDQAGNCKIDPSVDPVAARKVALYAIYTIDHRIQKTMDGEDDDDKATQGDGAGIVLPVTPNFYLSTGYGAGAYGGGDPSFHRGVDLVTRTGVVQSIRDGTVISVGDSQGNNTVAIKHSDGLVSWYLHMFAKDILVNEGDVVTAGQQIGVEGDAGQSQGTHLHFSLKINDLNDPSAYSEYPIDPTGRFINPVTYFTKNGFTGFE